MKAVSVKLTIEQKCNVITIHDRLNLCTEKRNPTRIKSTVLNKNYFEISIFAVISSTFSLLKVKSFRYLSKKKKALILSRVRIEFFLTTSKLPVEVYEDASNTIPD